MKKAPELGWLDSSELNGATAAFERVVQKETLLLLGGD